jgi:hypothetical protein
MSPMEFAQLRSELAQMEAARRAAGVQQLE